MKADLFKSAGQEGNQPDAPSINRVLMEKMSSSPAFFQSQQCPD